MRKAAAEALASTGEPAKGALLTLLLFVFLLLHMVRKFGWYFHGYLKK